METAKNIFYIVLALVLIAGMLFLFFRFTLPAFNRDLEQMLEQEMAAHNVTLEEIKQDFSTVLSYENVAIDMGQNIALVISGENCELKVTLNRELQVLSLETVDKTENQFVGPTFACMGEGIGVIFAIVWICFTIKDIACDIDIARQRRHERKQAKRQQTDIEVIV